MLYRSLHEVAARLPQGVALRQDDRCIDWASLRHASERVAGLLVEHGVRAGDRVALLAANGIDPVIALWAIWRLGAISVYLNEQLKPSTLAEILADAAPALVLRSSTLVGDELPRSLACACIELPTFDATSSPRPDVEDLTTLPDAPRDADLPAAIIYTSGSTGTPKGVCLSHGNLISVAEMAAEGYGTVAEDRYLMVVPLHYIHGLMILVALQARGASIEFMNGFAFPSLVTRRLQQSRITGFSGVPYHFSALIERGGLLEADLPCLRWIGVTGGTISPERIRQIRTAQPAIELHVSYGLTECSPRITLLDPARIDAKPTSVGQAARGLEVTFLDDDGRPVAPGEIGELVVSGPNVMLGYWDDAEATARVIDAQGRLRTGDLGYVDPDGDIFIRGRKQSMIKTAGERIFPEELERLLNAHPSVSDAAVVGVPDALYGQRVEAHVVLSSEEWSSDPTAVLQAWCLERVPYARAPRRFHLWKAFPLKANGKVDKQSLIAGPVGEDGPAP